MYLSWQVILTFILSRALGRVAEQISAAVTNRMFWFCLNFVLFVCMVILDSLLSVVLPFNAEWRLNNVSASQWLHGTVRALKCKCQSATACHELCLFYVFDLFKTHVLEISINHVIGLFKTCDNRLEPVYTKGVTYSKLWLTNKSMGATVNLQDWLLTG